MNENSTSLNRLHDIIVPPDVSWWPLAQGWYVLIVLILGAIVYWSYRTYRQWQANTFRRAALQELASADSISAISELLRRTALKSASRRIVASQTGSNWPAWLAACLNEPMPGTCRQQLADGGYSTSDHSLDLHDLKAYAADWIKFHRVPMSVQEHHKPT